MKLYIMRHGETDWNLQGLIQGSADIPLNEYGIELAEKTRDGLEKDGIIFDKIFTSPYIRAKKTAEIIARAKAGEVLVNQQIREMSFGDYEGAKLSELLTDPAYAAFSKCFTDPVHYKNEGRAESFSELFERVDCFLQDTILPLEGSCDHVLVVCHGAVLRAFISIFKKLPLEEYWSILQPNCSVNLAEVKDGRITMVEENRLYYEAKAQPGRRIV